MSRVRRCPPMSPPAPQTTARRLLIARSLGSGGVGAPACGGREGGLEAGVDVCDVVVSCPTLREAPAGHELGEVGGGVAPVVAVESVAAVAVHEPQRPLELLTGLGGDQQLSVASGVADVDGDCRAVR